ncbi:MAG: flagellar biosynthesis regulator FlaF [Alphaproteobacteria bacterium]|nr:flagellar biosynthesis regulator FlaF [Rhodospirillales bacterium]MCW9044950.1 flagellar biosynthesis regulator FlaF [Alphaproteobacteria bacterium]
MTLPSGYAAYAQTHSSALKGASAEGEALGKASRLLEKARLNPQDNVALAHALQFNQKLWTIFQADLADERNPLPDDLKTDLLSLSLFMDQTIAELSQGPTTQIITESLQAMIDINRSLATAILR